MAKIKIIPLDKSTNFQELVLDGFDAIEMAIYQMLQTPMGSLPKLPYEGFDLDDLRGLPDGSATYEKLVAELKSKIESIVNSSNVTCDITKHGEVIDIVITYFHEGELKVLPIRQKSAGARVELLFDNIMLK